MLTPTEPTTARPPAPPDHRALRQLLRDLSTCSGAPALERGLSGLHAFLVQHFEQEEAAGGFFEVVDAAGVAAEGELARLRREHADLLGSVAEMVGALRGTTRDVSVDVPSLLASIRSHEEREDALMYQAVGRDLGGGD